MSFIKNPPEKYQQNLDHLKIHSPHFWKNPLTTQLTKSEMKNYEIHENTAINQIKTKLKQYPSIGGLFLEPIIGPYGVYFYRPEFLLQIQSICKEHSILLIADETLTVGRTGKFFAYEYYDDFKPDFIIFGKGIGVSGISCSDKWKDQFNFETWTQTTITADAHTLLRSTLILNRIADDNLMKNIEEVGSHLIGRLKDHEKHVSAKHQSRGIGGLIYSTTDLLIKRAVFRLLPPLTLTKEMVDKLFTNLQFPEADYCHLCKTGGKLLLCDGCPKAFHLDCLNLKEFPKEEFWYCNDCD
jgi:4-aminobutyrate aminotransferase-like enzyme